MVLDALPLGAWGFAIGTIRSVATVHRKQRTGIQSRQTKNQKGAKQMARSKKVEVLDIQTVQVPRGEIARAVLMDQEEAAGTLKFVQDELKIETFAQYVAAGEMLKTLAFGHDQLKAKRDGWTFKLQEVIDDIRSTIDPSIKALKRGEELVREKLSAFAADAMLARSTLIAQASVLFEGGEHAQGTSVLEEAKAMDLPEIPGVTVKTAWTGIVDDANAMIDAVIAGKLSREHLVPNAALCEEETAAKQGDPKIPGWRAYPAANLRASRKG